MTTITLQGGTKVELYESIFEMPTYHYSKFEANRLLEAGIGNVLSILERSMMAIGDNDNDRALTEVQNAYIGLKHAEAEYDPKQVQFGWCIAAVNDEPVKHTTNEQRQKVVHDLGLKGLLMQQVFDFDLALKKNLNPN